MVPASDAVQCNSDVKVEADVSSQATTLQDAKNSSSMSEALALPVLERHGQAPASLDDGEQSSPAGEGAVSAAGGVSSMVADSEDAVKAEKSSFDDDDDREMPELTLYAL